MNSFAPFDTWLIWWQWLLLGLGLMVPYFCYLLIHRKDYSQPYHLDQSISFWGILTTAPLFVGMLIVFTLWIICLVTFYWMFLAMAVAVFFYSIIAGEVYLHQFR